MNALCVTEEAMRDTERIHCILSEEAMGNSERMYSIYRIIQTINNIYSNFVSINYIFPECGISKNK